MACKNYSTFYVFANKEGQWFSIILIQCYQMPPDIRSKL